MLKIIDKYIIKEYIGPFFVSFFIALFVLLMQQVWVYIDDIMGKGAGILFISEMIFYLSIYMMPMALVIGVLISSVMSVGNLAEKYELSSMKSAGVSVFRVILPLVIACFGLAIFSFMCSDVFGPWAKLRYNARLYDIRRSKPAMAIEEGVFSDNFAGYTLRIGKKGKDNTSIQNVMIYQLGVNGGGLSELLAKSGEMTSSADNQYMLMRLQDGRRYENLKDDNKHRFAFVRTNFKEWNKIFILDELERTDAGLFGNSPTTKTALRLSADIDSIGRKLEDRKEEFSKSLNNSFTFLTKSKKDSSATVYINQNQSAYQNNQPKKSYLNVNEAPPEQITSGDVKTYGNFSNTIIGYKRADILNRTKSQAQSILDQSVSTGASLDKLRESQVKHIHEFHNKFVFASLCIIFLFVGAPMGAIVRKGGFGYPVLIAIGFFILFIFNYIMFRKLGEQGALPPVISIWLPAIFISCIGAFLTYKAMRDERVFNTENLAFIGKFFKKFKKAKEKPNN